MENRTDCKSTAFSSTLRMNCRGRELKIDHPLIMGIMNLTPDSFYDGGFYPSQEDMLRHVGQMIRDGAEIVDLGAVSTRPGSVGVSPQEEEDRLLPALDMIRKQFPEIFLSVDTYRSEIARKAIDLGADMINDISAGRFDPAMIPVLKGYGIPYIMMHMQGQPENMQHDPFYEDVLGEVRHFFEGRIAEAAREGIQDLIIDPGFGFGKTVEHNYLLLAHLEQFLALGRPVMVGLSRKSMINRVLGTNPTHALNGTTVLNTIAILKGAHILRVHDVREAAEAMKLCREYVTAIEAPYRANDN